LQDAEKLAPDDFVVLNNLAQAYKRKGDKTKAIAYFEKVVKFGDAETTEFAKKELLELKKNQ
jgi:cytochrome c-type biogenesis protein CcmH/NrfG